MVKELQSNEWYEALVEECKAIITEAVFTSRWALVEGYWKLGERVQEDNDFKAFQKGNKTSVQDLAQNLGISERTLYYALKAYEKFPDLGKIPEGKNITWNKLITQYLPEPKEKKEPLLPIKGKYNVFVIDPPWAYGTEYDSESRRVASPYPEKSIEELKEWGITEFEKSADKNSVIWLWTTHKFLNDSFELLKDWGFDYKLTMVWDKQKLGMGVWLRCQAEFCLVGVKGDYHKHWNLTNERDIISSPRAEHSRKPKEFYEMVEKLCSGKKIDIFSREKHNGFIQYGNETGKF